MVRFPSVALRLGVCGLAAPWYFLSPFYLTVEPDFENNILHGKLAFIRDLVTFEAETLADLEREFKTSVDLYLQSCVEDGKEPDTPFKSVFNVRLDPELGTGKRSH
ncbi:HicB family [Shigella sonnei]|uniref:type II toxin-antitoxin system HicB family antitoxin n=1 Tax=Shigella sonnei TaxID=624 RepID=UPI0006641094|nr:type II toxin-antitoxin system HicB family antitoxin [Shigella sonnei]CSS86192.1 HicB family [Shigella sonnei]CSS86457.1 HicB family [Shigella sonnei]